MAPTFEIKQALHMLCERSASAHAHTLGYSPLAQMAEYYCHGFAFHCEPASHLPMGRQIGGWITRRPYCTRCCPLVGPVPHIDMPDERKSAPIPPLPHYCPYRPGPLPSKVPLLPPVILNSVLGVALARLRSPMYVRIPATFSCISSLGCLSKFLGCSQTR